MLAAIIALAAALRFWALSAESLWFDEAFNVMVAEWDVRWIILKLTELGLRSTDRNTFTLMLHYVLLLGRTEVFIRAIPAISGVLSVLALYALARRLFDRRVALLASFLLAISPMHIWFSRDARSYALLALFAILAAYFLVRALADNRFDSWIGFAVLSALATYTHAFGILANGALALCALVHLASKSSSGATVKRMAAAHILLLILLAPFLHDFMSQSFEGWGSWIGEKYGTPTVKSLGITMAVFSFWTAYDRQRLVYISALALFAVPCLLALVALARSVRDSESWRRHGQPLLFTLIFLCGPIAALFLASQFKPMYLARYMLAFLPPYLLLVAYGVLRVPSRMWRGVLLAALVVVTIPALVYVSTPGKKENWRGAVQYIEQELKKEDLVVLYDAYMTIPFNYYYHDKARELLISRDAPEDELDRHVLDMASMPHKVWVVFSHADEARLARKIEARSDVTRLETHDFLGLRVVKYEVLVRP